MTVSPVNPRPVQSAGQIDLGRHAVIEASAGTGKTHTIKELVVALLRGNDDLSLDQILIVTFTDKATGELKEKIRQNIQKAIGEKWSSVLQASLDAFDTSSIYTIHGFCNKILQEYAFENGEQFHNELIDDAVIYRKALIHIMREQWPAQYGNDLPALLSLSGFPGSTGSDTSPWMDRVIDIALRYQPACGDLLEPSDDADLPGNMKIMEEACHSCLDSLLPHAGAIDTSDISRSELFERYASLNIKSNMLPKRLRVVAAVLRLLSSHQAQRTSLAELSEFFNNKQIKKDIEENGFTLLDDGWKKTGPDYREKLPDLPKIIELLEKLRSIDLTGFKHLLAAQAVRDIKRKAAEMKKARGLLSYDDMLGRVSAALDASPELRALLQRRFRYALIDEFQDTDLLQWKIFKTIFLDSGKNRLFIIGDPKQAIYGFRGADVNAYFIARDEMISSYGAEYYCLNENWRSSPGLIGCFNTIFGSDRWFTASNIRYLPVSYPRDKNPGRHSFSGSLRIVGLGQCTGTEAKFKTSDFIAGELKRITAAEPSVDLGKIAVLVVKWKEAAAIEKSMQKFDIRYSYYKKEGLYQTREALELGYLLAAIARPNDIMSRKKALLTRFFNIPVRSIGYCDSIPAGHPASLLFERWVMYAAARNWPHLFQSIMEDTGILFREDIENRDRTMLNFRSITQNLEIEALRRNYCIQEIADFLTALESHTASSHESYNIQTIDADRPGVQLLTIHASKGLEFDTVFIAGGFTYKDVSTFWTYHRDNRRIFDLASDPEGSDLYDAEISGDEERLFYVAMTRAKNLLYIPVFEPTPHSKKTSGILGDKLLSILTAMRNDANVSWIDLSARESAPSGQHEPPVPQTSPPVLPDPLFSDPSLQFLERTISLESFSGLKQRLFAPRSPEHSFREYGHGGPLPGEDDMNISTVQETRAFEPTGVLPRSKETGLMLHEILEHIDFNRVAASSDPEQLVSTDTDTASKIDRSIARHMKYSLPEDASMIRKETARLLWNTINTPLTASGLSLRNLDKKIHEAEFFYPAGPFRGLEIPGVPLTRGYLHGFIDMIFLSGEMYYIVDWKSNYIDDGYAPEILENNINAMHYDLQIRIYSAAVVRWLKSLKPDYSYDRHFGGVYYLYLRGLNKENPGSGVYFFRPDNDEDILDTSFIPE